jgi:hypothetical protein
VCLSHDAPVYLTFHHIYDNVTTQCAGHAFYLHVGCPLIVVSDPRKIVALPIQLCDVSEDARGNI